MDFSDWNVGNILMLIGFCLISIGVCAGLWLLYDLIVKVVVWIITSLVQVLELLFKTLYMGFCICCCGAKIRVKVPAKQEEPDSESETVAASQQQNTNVTVNLVSPATQSNPPVQPAAKPGLTYPTQGPPYTPYPMAGAPYPGLNYPTAPMAPSPAVPSYPGMPVPNSASHGVPQAHGYPGAYSGISTEVKPPLYNPSMYQ